MMNQNTKKHQGRPAGRKRSLFQRLLSIVLGVAMLLPTMGLEHVFAQTLAPNIELSASIVQNKGDTQTVSEVESGESFFLAIRYTFSSSQEDVTYENAKISIPLPDYVKYETTELTSEFVSAEEKVNPGLGTRQIEVTCTPNVASGKSGTVYLKCHFENMVTPNDTTALFNNMAFTGMIMASDATSPINLPITSVSVKSTAKQDWEVAKSVPETHVVPEGDWYHVVYTINVSDLLAANRYGRLHCDPFTLVDTFPTGYPAGGGAVLEYVTSESKTLAAGSDYTVHTNGDGSVASIEFLYHNAFDEAAYEGQALIPDGAQLPTSYTVAVKYPRQAYVLPSNIPFDYYELTNTVKLNYTALGEPAVEKSAQATIYLGETEAQTTPVSFSVEKTLRIGGDALSGTNSGSFVLDAAKQAAYGTAKFALYTDENCQNLAPNIDHSATAGSEQEIGADGRVTFGNLRYGAYYLKETAAPDGFTAAAVKKIEISAAGVVTVDGTALSENQPVSVENITDENGVGYVAFWKKGNNAGDATYGYLAGIPFTLTSKADPAKSYRVTSGADGLVLFEGIPAGAYTLQEQTPSEFIDSGASYEVNVTGNTVNYPQSLNKDENQKPFIENNSTKGKLSVLKVNADNQNEKLAGAKFELYGPYAAGTTAPNTGDTAIATLTTGQDGIALSGALVPGTYLLKESKAPLGYSAYEGYVAVDVTAHHTEQVTVSNEKQGTLQILKYGRLLSGGQPIANTGLAGATFGVYSDENATTPVRGEDGNPVVIATTVDGSGAPNTPKVTLKAGTYYYKELSVPDGYKLDATIYRVEIAKGADVVETRYNETDILGQLTLVKASDQDGNKLSGAVFGLYRADAPDVLVQRLTTGADGSVTSKFLKEGNYILKEITAPSGYLKEDQIYNTVTDGVAAYDQNGSGIAVSNNTIVAVTIKDQPYVKIVIKKTDSVKPAANNNVLSFFSRLLSVGDKAPIQGATFALYPSEQDAIDGANAIASKTTGADGTVTFDQLTPGKQYWYKETKTPAGYLSDGTPVSVVAPSKTDGNYEDKYVSVENTRKGKFSLYKTIENFDGSGSTGKVGVVFQYYPKKTADAAADLEKAELDGTLLEMTTAAGGKATSKEVAPDDYWVVEKAAPAGCNAAPAQTVTVTAGAGCGAGYDNATELTFHNEYYAGKVKIRKISSVQKENADVPVKATFAVYQYVEGLSDYSQKTPVTTMTTNANTGASVSGYLPAGEYVLVETAVTGEYVLDATAHRFTVEAGKTTDLTGQSDTIVNVPKQRIGIDKFTRWLYAGSEGNPYEQRQSGVTFNIYSDAACSADTLVATVISGSSTAYSAYLAPGTYWVKEEPVPADYTVDGDNPRQVALTAGKDEVLTWYNTPTKGALKLMKLDKANNNPLDRAKFELYVVDPDGEASLPSDPNVKLRKISNMESGTGLTATGSKEHGAAYETMLEFGTYYLKETAAPSGYLMSTQWSGPYEVSEAGKIVTATLYNYQPTPTEGRKIDQNGNAVSGAWVGLFATRAAAEAAQSNLLTDKNYYAGIVADSSLWAENGIVSAAKSDSSGKLAFLELAPNSDYYALELVGVSGYVHNTEIYEVSSLKQDQNWILVNQGTTDPFRLPNESYGQIALKKVVSLSGKKYPLNGVVFNIYKAAAPGSTDISGGVVTTATTGNASGLGEGTFLSAHLEPGWYVLEEASVPDGIVLSGQRWAVQVTANGTHSSKKDGINYTYYQTPIENSSLYGQFVLSKQSAYAGDHGKKLTATFKVQKLNEITALYEDYYSGDQVYTVTTGQNPVVSAMLPAGAYQLVETSVEDGYTLDETPILFTIEGGKITGNNLVGGVYQPLANPDTDQRENPIIVQNDKQGALSLLKQGQILDQPLVTLPGITFALYAYTGDAQQESDLAGTPVAQQSTDNSGLLKISGLDAGTYWLKETDLGAHTDSGYEVNLVKKVEIVAGETTTEIVGGGNLVNVTTYGKLSLEKVDADNAETKIAGVHFGIYDSETADHQVSVMTTGATGVALSGLLPPGQYWVKEISGPDAYFTDTDTIYGPYTVNKNAVTTVGANPTAAPAQITNAKKQQLKLTKLDAISGEKVADEAMASAEFKLYAQKGADGMVEEDSYVTTGVYDNSEKVVAFNGLYPHTTYYIKETARPAGYVLSDAVIEVTTDGTGVTTASMDNTPCGSIELLKMAQWNKDDSGAQMETLPLEGVGFTLYYYDADAADHIGALAAAQKLTDSEGKITFSDLVPGQYVLVETAKLDGFSDPAHTAYELEVRAGEKNDAYLTSPIINMPELGKFILTKQKADGSALGGAVFALYSGDTAKQENYLGDLTVADNGAYSSGMMEPEVYTVVEKTAPQGYALNPTPYTFEIKSSQIVQVGPVVDDALGNIAIHKIGDAGNGSPDLSGAKFQLFDAGGNKVGSEMTTAANGIITWSGVTPGDYTIKETAAPAGYAADDTEWTVTVPAGQSSVKTYYPDGTNNGTIVNVADSGRLRLYKENENAEPLGGAVFEVYALSDDTVGALLDTITTGANGYGISNVLLPASPAGTRYFVKEVKAPDGYTLDPRYHETSKVVTVCPVMAESKLAAITTNNLAFTNKNSGDIHMFATGIEKTIANDQANKSLLIEPFSTSFTLRGYAEGDNELDAQSLIVTDNDIAMQWLEGANYHDETLSEGDYRITDATIYRAYNEDGSQVDAVLEYQNFANLGSENWIPVGSGNLTNIQNLGNNGLTVSLPDGLGAMAIRVRYFGVEKHFKAEGIDFNATFAKRPADENKHEIRRITNQASVSYSYRQYGPDGTLVSGMPTTATVYSNEVTAVIPLVAEQRVPVSLSIAPAESGRPGNIYYPGESVAYTVVAKNESSSVNFTEPVISFDIPADTTLTEQFIGGKMFSIMYMEDNIIGGSWGNPITPSDIFITDTEASTVTGGKPVGTGQTTKKVTMKFKNFSMAPGKRIVIKFGVVIDPESRLTSLWAPAYLGSLYELPTSAENPYGISYTPGISQGGVFVPDAQLSDVLGNGGSEYINANGEITVQENNSLYIFKQVKGEYDDDYRNYNQLGHTAPNGSIKYRIQFRNNATSSVSKARVVDILPFEGDSLTDRTGGVLARGTTLSKRPTLESVSVSGADPSAVTIYYCLDDVSTWGATSRAAITKEEELPMLYGSVDDDAWDSTAYHNWTTQTPSAEQMANVTAIGVEVNQTLTQGQSFDVHVNMKAPIYATGEVSEYVGKYISNSAMCSAVRQGDASPTIQVNNRSENKEVKVVLDLPKGKIGDYAFYDANQNGLQDHGELPVAGLKVTLHKTTLTAGADQKQTLTYQTQTDANGLYLFEGLDCNIPLDADQWVDEDPGNPANYVDGKLYLYQVSFDTPQGGYAPTTRYAGGDQQIDSDIDKAGMSGTVTLGVTEVGGKLYGEENRSIDAGFIIPSALGDYVWVDENRNGIQDETDTGVQNVVVNLYQAGSDGSKGALIDSMRTDEDGYYLFDTLAMGKYLVEYDISGLSNDYGLYAYAFSEAGQGDGPDKAVYDSDAKHKADEDDRIRYTDVIDLGYQQRDLSWDAGLIYYSALGGVAFDDANYTDLQDIGIALPGTAVKLYRVINGIREQTPLRETTVKEDGSYLFENLIEGDYQVYFDFPDAYRAVLAHQGANDEIDSDVSLELSDDLNSGYTPVITLPANTISLHWDGGARKYGVIGDYVWEDTNKDGIQDAGEMPIANITVYLQRRNTQSGLWEDFGMTATDQSGRYVFSDLPGGVYTGNTYRVVFDIPAGNQITIPETGEDVQRDSNALATYIEGWGYPSDIISLGYGQTDLSWDAGVIRSSGSIGDYIWIDANHNGLQDEGEAGVPGITVILEQNILGDPLNDAGWQRIGERVTNLGGYYRFDDLEEGYYRVGFMVDGMRYDVTMANAGEGVSAFLADSDGTIKSGALHYSRAFYLDASGFDMSWDCGLCLKGSGFAQTGDPGSPWMWLLIAGAAGGLFVMAAYRKRRLHHQ